MTIVGRSGIVGTPLALLLSRKGVDATVTLAIRAPKTSRPCAREADVLVAAWACRARRRGARQEGRMVVDVGIRRVGRRGTPRSSATSMPRPCTGSPPRFAVPGGVGP